MKSQKADIKRAGLIVLMIAALGLSGCGAQTASRDGSSVNASRSQAQADDAIECNEFTASGTTLKGRLMIYTAPDGSARDDIMRLRITDLNATFDSNSNLKIRAYRIEGRPDGSWNRDAQPLEMRVELPRAGSPLPLSGYATGLSITDVNRMKSSYGITANKAADFFNRVDILVFGVESRWDVLQIVLVEEGSNASSSKVIGHANALMPSFSADPTAYASNHHTSLAELHPFWSRRGVDYLAESQAWCF